MPGQTLRQVRELLAGADLAPQHRYGQNFLIDLNLMRKLVGAAELSPGDVVLEVGPGTGSLTELLLDSGARVVAVEIDRGLQGILRARLGAHPRFTLVQGDALAAKSRVNPLLLRLLAERAPAAAPGPAPGAYKLVANLPYQIATPLLIDLLLVQPRFERLVGTIQKEVGERLVAEPRTPAYGPVSIILQTLADIRPLAILPPAAFWPRPEVESVMVLIRPRPPREVQAAADPADQSCTSALGGPRDAGVADVPGFVQFVRTAFQQRRKVLRRLLRDWEPARLQAVFQRARVNPEARPEELSPSAWRTLYAAIRRAAP